MSVLWFANLAILLAFIKIFETPPLIPTLSEELGISFAQAGMFMTVYAVVRCLASSPAGFISDRWGVVPVITVSLLGVGICGLLGTLGSSYEIMLVLRTLVSIGVAVIFIAAIDAVPKYLPPERVGAGIGIINVSLNIGLTAALLMTPILSEAFGWRWTTRAYSLAFLALVVISLLTVRGQAAAAATEEPQRVTLAELLRNPLVLLLAVAACVVFIEMYGMLTWVPAYLGSVFEYGPGEIGFSAMWFGLAAIPSSMLAGYLCTNLTRILWLCLTGGVMAGIGIMGLLSAPRLDPWVAAALISLLTWGHSQIIVAIMSLASLILPAHSSGRALGLVFSIGYAGSIFSTYLGGYLVDTTGSYQLSFIVYAVAALVAAGLMALMCGLLRSRPPAHFALGTG